MVSIANSNALKSNSKSNLKSKSKSKSNSRSREHIKLDFAVNALAIKRLGSPVAKVQFPGGKSRTSYRAILKNEQSVIVSKRATLMRSQLECMVLRILGNADMPVPNLLASDGGIFFQQDVGTQRLSERLDACTSGNERLALLDSAVVGLSAIQNCASEAGLDTRVPLLGREKIWRQEFAELPQTIGEFLGVAAPAIDKDAIIDVLAVLEPRFVKWDARPGNALVDSNGTVIWIDWEHCGARNRLDDLAWLLADEYNVDDEATERQLLDRHLDKFKDERDTDSAFEYLMVYGTLHTCVRLGMILDRKVRNKGGREGKGANKGDWWDPQYCLAGDKIGVTQKMAERQCQRASRWAANSRLLTDLSEWFREAQRAIVKL